MAILRADRICYGLQSGVGRDKAGSFGSRDGQATAKARARFAGSADLWAASGSGTPREGAALGALDRVEAALACTFVSCREALSGRTGGRETGFECPASVVAF